MKPFLLAGKAQRLLVSRMEMRANAKAASTLVAVAVPGSSRNQSLISSKAAVACAPGIVVPVYLSKISQRPRLQSNTAHDQSNPVTSSPPGQKLHSYMQTTTNMSVWIRSNPFTSLPTTSKFGFTTAPTSQGGPVNASQLPRSFREVLQSGRFEHVPLVVTTAHAPYRIVHVNVAWEDLCGYTKREALHRSIPELLHGPRSNVEAANSLVNRLLQTNESQETYLINYTKEGEAFCNHIVVGSMSLDEESNTTSIPMFFVGMLEKVDRERVPLKMAL